MIFLLEVIKAFRRAKLSYAVAGGYAVSLHGAVRGTLDIDLMVSLKPKHLAAAEAALQSIGLRSRIPVTAEEISQFRQEYLKRRNLIAWRFVDPRDPTRMVDLLLLEDVSKQSTITKKISGVPVQILSIPSLIKMKKAVARPQDLEDVRALERLR